MFGQCGNGPYRISECKICASLKLKWKSKTSECNSVHTAWFMRLGRAMSRSLETQTTSTAALYKLLLLKLLVAVSSLLCVAMLDAEDIDAIRDCFCSLFMATVSSTVSTMLLRLSTYTAGVKPLSCLYSFLVPRIFFMTLGSYATAPSPLV